MKLEKLKENIFHPPPLHIACQKGYLGIVEFFVNDGEDINLPSIFYANLRPIHFASQGLHLSISEYLINEGADINATNRNALILNFY